MVGSTAGASWLFLVFIVLLPHRERDPQPVLSCDLREILVSISLCRQRFKDSRDIGRWHHFAELVVPAVGWEACARPC